MVTPRLTTAMPTPIDETPSTNNIAKEEKVKVWSRVLYDKCQETWPETAMFTQADMLSLDVIPNRNINLLLEAIQVLSNAKLLISLKENSGQMSWKWREEEEAEKYKQCANEEQVMVYSAIDESGGDGMWSQTIQKRLNMHDSVFKSAVKVLQAKGLIVPFKNVEHPNKKMYIKASIRPSERATGGPWYTDQNLDEAFIGELQKVIFDYVKQESVYLSRHTNNSNNNNNAPRTQAPKKGVLKGVNSQKGVKREASGDLETPPVKTAKISTAATPSRKTEPRYLPLPAGYTEYPTVRDIARFLTKTGITNNTILTEEDVRKLVDVLVWDTLLEPIEVAGRSGFRVAEAAKQSIKNWAGEDPTNPDSGPKPRISPYTEAPCGRCPVFDLCEEGGPVGPSNCEYFKKWLGLDE